MLLMDGVKYQEWTPSSEREFERIVSEHASEIFGENSIYIDRKLKLHLCQASAQYQTGMLSSWKTHRIGILLK